MLLGGCQFSDFAPHAEDLGAQHSDLLSVEPHHGLELRLASIEESTPVLLMLEVPGGVGDLLGGQDNLLLLVSNEAI